MQKKTTCESCVNLFDNMKDSFKAAWPHTIPVLAGYLFLGIAFGILVITKGFPVWYPVFMSVIIFSGALEFAAIPLLSAGFSPLSSFVMGLMISARHLFYGIPMLKKYQDAGKLKPFLIFSLTDETFSINSTIDPPDGIPGKYFYTAVSLLDYSYWVIGTTIGALFGKLIHFDTTGIDFALTALFIVLFLEQIKTKEGKISGLTGLLSSGAVLAIFGSANMVVIAMAVILLALLIERRVIFHD